MRVASVAMLLVGVGCVLSTASLAQGPNASLPQSHNVFSDADKKRVDTLRKELTGIARDLFKHINNTVPSPVPRDEECRRWLHTNTEAALDPLHQVSILVDISSVLTSRNDEMIVIGRVRRALNHALFSIDLCSRMAKSVSEIPSCNTDSYISRKIVESLAVCSQGKTLLDELFARVKQL
jgi:hypothetical protein